MVVSALASLTARYIRLVFRTSTLLGDPSDLQKQNLHPVIAAVWHGQFLLIPNLLRPEIINIPGLKVKSMVARHADAEIIGRVQGLFGIECIRGAGAAGRKKDRGGTQAFRGALEALQQGCTVAMTADVPPGPARKAGRGIVMLAQRSGRPVLPLAMATNRYIAFNTWSRFTVNLPFSRLGIVAGEPIHVERDADDNALEAARLKVETALNDATARAYALAGADPVRAAPPGKGGRAKPGFLLKLYRLLTSAARPAAGLILRYRSRQGKELPERLGERFGVPGAPRAPGRLWWIHAASVGETNSILPLLDALRKERPHLNILLTTMTVTSARIAAERLPAGAVHQFVPLDNPAFVRRFLGHWRPDLALFTESEIWPNLILETAARGTPLVLLNARMSDRSYKRWRGKPGLSAPLFSRFDLVLAQNQRLAIRLQRLGAPRTLAVGNIKFDAPPPPVDKTELLRLQAATGGRPVFLAASTHPGEEEIIASAYLALRNKIPGLLPIIVPRHPDRGYVIASALGDWGIRVARRSQGLLPDGHTGIYVADTIGELGLYYALAPAAFIGGSLVRHGGQNPIEAVKLGSAVLTGPHWHNFKEAYKALVLRGGCRVVSGREELTAAVAELYASPAAMQAMRERAGEAVAELGGALRKTLAELDPYLQAGETPPPLEEPLKYAS